MREHFGRFYYLPVHLAAVGHEVDVFLFDHRLSAFAETQCSPNGIRWHCVPVFAFGQKQSASRIASEVASIAPHWIIGFSDTYYGILAEIFARRFGACSLIDAYDNYEGYVPWCAPLHWMWRRALRRATAVTAAGPALLNLLTRDRGSARSAVVPMAVDSPLFMPMSREQCRRELGLPEDGTLIGYSGSIAGNRGVSQLFEAVNLLQRKQYDVRLVLAGRRVGKVAIPADVTWLGALPADMVPTVINAMNVVAVINKLSKFGRYSYPTKLYEAMHCRVPVVATRTPATEWILSSKPEFLVEPNAPYSLAERIRFALSFREVEYGVLPTWEESARRLENLLVGT